MTAMSACSRLALIALLLLAGPAAAPARAVSPAPAPTGAGWPGGVVQPRDVSRYLAFHKLRAVLDPLAAFSPPTANQLAYDVSAYDLDVRPTIPLQLLRGSVRIRANVVSGPLFTMELDLADAMVVDSVTVAGAPAAFSRGADLLIVDLGRAWVTGEGLDVTVSYHGTPALGPFGAVFALTSHSGAPLVWTLSEPFGARAWWPCKDHPEDKADSVSVRLTVPSGMKTVSNGRQAEASDDGTVSVSRWVERHPISTYLVSLASHTYSVSTDWYRPSPADSMELLFYLFPEDSIYLVEGTRKVKEMIAVYAARFGEYPFLDEKYGEVEFTWGGGMENQTITSLGTFQEGIAAHELAHQWWGDWVTCRDFHHVWLNEGFATYGEALWAESQTGPAGYHANLAYNRYLGAGTVYVADEANVARMFDYNLTYNKASWVPHMLRHALGDSVFFASLREYGRRHAHGTATTEDLRDACEQVSGRGLDRFFQQWIYGEGYPQYGFRWESAVTAGGWDVTVELDQLQPGQLFWMPVDVVVHSGGVARTFVAWDSLPVQTFTFHVAGQPDSVQVDPDEWVLRSVAKLEGEFPHGRRELALLTPRPNPTAGSATFAFVLPQPGPARLEVFDVRGALVRRFDAGVLSAGSHQLPWDGRDAGGRAARPGLYVVRLEAVGEQRTQRLAVIR
jgi:aminopeptidase N